MQRKRRNEEDGSEGEGEHMTGIHQVAPSRRQQRCLKLEKYFGTIFCVTVSRIERTPYRPIPTRCLPLPSVSTSISFPLFFFPPSILSFTHPEQGGRDRRLRRFPSLFSVPLPPPPEEEEEELRDVEGKGGGLWDDSLSFSVSPERPSVTRSPVRISLAKVGNRVACFTLEWMEVEGEEMLGWDSAIFFIKKLFSKSVISNPKVWVEWFGYEIMYTGESCLQIPPRVLCLPRRGRRKRRVFHGGWGSRMRRKKMRLRRFPLQRSWIERI